MILSYELLLKIKSGYIKAKQDGADSFIAGGHEFHTAYAGFLLEHYAPQFNVPFQRIS